MFNKVKNCSCFFFKDMTPFYQECCTDLKWPVDQTLVNKMKKENETKLNVNDKKKIFSEMLNLLDLKQNPVIYD